MDNSVLKTLKNYDEKYFFLKKGFQFLDLFLDETKKLKKIETDKNKICIYDYRTEDKNYFDALEVQKIYQKLYIDYLYDNYFSGFLIHEKVKNLISSLLDYHNMDDEYRILLKTVLVRVFWGCFYILKENKIEKEEFINSFSKQLSSVQSSEFCYNFAVMVIETAILNDIFIEKDNIIRLNDECFFFHLKIMSLSVAKIHSNDQFNIKYSCNFNFNNLTTVVVNFFKYRNYYIFDKLHKILLKNEEKKFLEYFFNNFIYLDFNEFESFSDAKKEMFLVLFLEKIVLSSYCFHTIIVSCFENYFFCKDPNILKDQILLSLYIIKNA